MNNVLNTSYNKTVYTAFASALLGLIAALLDQFEIPIKPMLWAGIQGVISTAIPLFVPNSEAPSSPMPTPPSDNETGVT